MRKRYSRIEGEIHIGEDDVCYRVHLGEMLEKPITQTDAEQKPRTTRPDEQIWDGALPEKQLGFQVILRRNWDPESHEDSPQCGLTPECSSPRSYKKTVP